MAERTLVERLRAEVRRLLEAVVGESWEVDAAMKATAPHFIDRMLVAAREDVERQEREIERLRGELEALRDGSPRHLSRRIAELQARGFERVNAPDPQLTRESPERYGLGGSDG